MTLCITCILVDHTTYPGLINLLRMRIHIFLRMVGNSERAGVLDYGLDTLRSLNAYGILLQIRGRRPG